MLSEKQRDGVDRMSAVDETIEWCKKERSALRKRLDDLEAGRETVHLQRGLNSPVIDNTAETIKDVKGRLAEVEGILERQKDTAAA
jgi:hypothetical protein